MDSKYRIPVIDIQGLRSGNLEEVEEAAKKIGDACKDIGFFYIVNHGISTNIIDDTFRYSKEFFDLPLNEKMKYSLENNSMSFRGYSPALSELADGKRNSYELMEFSVEFAEDHPDALAKKPMHGPNQWPSIPGYKETITGYIKELNLLGFDLMKAIAISLGLDKDYFYHAFNGRSFWQFRAANYQTPDKILEMMSDIEVGDYSCGAHTDYGCLTILLANNSGLQVFNKNGEWFDAPVIPDAYICNIGDMLQYWTRDLFVATKHRVLTNQERMSLPFFFQPDFETVIYPLDHISTSSKRQFSPLKYGPYAFENYKSIYPAAKHP